ncbi:hypothetical protein [Streptomyces sp. NPDC003023]|uniref:hypothetical protein n=1 Tax=Streptomyces sp. NPDC003023 TaxID=3364675 RepID=UPI0036A9317E
MGNYFGTLVEIAGCDRLEWPVTALAGRAITAYANSQVWMIETGKNATGPFRLADLAEDFEEAVESVMSLWWDYRNEVVDAAFFSVEFERAVIKMERWPDA